MSGAKEWTESVDDFNRLQFDDSFPLEEGEEVLDVDLNDDLSSSIDVLEDVIEIHSTPSFREAFWRDRYFSLGIVLLFIIFVSVFGVGVYLSYIQQSDDTDSTPGDLNISDRTVILISLDGFANEYLFDESLDDVRTNIDLFKLKSAYSEMIPVFPAVTYPNHWSMITGVYPETHGVIENYMYDPSTDEYFSIFDDSVYDAYWYGAEPIWETYSKYGGVSASLFYPGSYCDGLMPTYSIPPDDSMTYSDRINQIMEWLKMDDNDRPRLITIYFSAVDSAGHESGTNSPLLRDSINSIDEALGDLFDKVNELDISDSINYLIVSDHGMTNVDETQVIYLDDFIDLDNDADVITWGTFISIRALYGRSAQLYYQLQTMEHAIIYEKDSIPIEYHYTFNDRIPDIVIIAEEGWYITSRERGNMDYKTGDHGYIPSNPSMSSFLLASGDIFVEGYESNTIIENIHLYSLMGKILNIGVAPNNGTWVSLCPLLNNQC